MNSRLALLCVALAAALASVSARELECEVCRKVSGVVEAVLKQNASATSTFTQVATALCDHVPEGMYEQCTTAVEGMDSDVFRCMIQQADFRTLCSDPSVALCKAPVAPYKADLSCHNFLPHAMHCAACKFAVGGLQQYVNDTSSKMVQSIGGDICRFHFKRNDMKQMCRVIMTSFGDVMLRVLASRIDANDFCCEVGLCDIPVNADGTKWTATDAAAAEAAAA